MKPIAFDFIKDKLTLKNITVVGSGPSILSNNAGYIDSFDYVIRVNNYKCLNNNTGFKTNIVYSFWGNSIKKNKDDLKDVEFLMCKCPSCYCHKAPSVYGGSFEWIYRLRGDFWDIPVYIPNKETYMNYFYLLKGHVPSTGFACILEILKIPYKSLYITGFDFFQSGIHDVNVKWNSKNNDDPIRHMPEFERKILSDLYKMDLFKCDIKLQRLLV